jgi:hypothetical protein
MWVDIGEVEFSGEKEDDGADSGEGGITTGFAFGGLEESVDGFEEAIGLSGTSSNRLG